MPIVTQCTAPGCKTLTIGSLCLDHEVVEARTYVRGRPFLRAVAEMHSRAAATPVRVGFLRTASARLAAARAHR
jgi:hypothetical protein